MRLPGAQQRQMPPLTISTCGVPVALAITALAMALAVTPANAVTWSSATVSGNANAPSSYVNGFPGTSVLVAPMALCNGVDGRTMYIGDSGYMRSYTAEINAFPVDPQATYTGMLFGNGTVLAVDGTAQTARANAPWSCIAATTASGNARVVYFVEQTQQIGVIMSAGQGIQVSRVTLNYASSLAISGISFFNNNLYVTNQALGEVLMVTVDSVTSQPFPFVASRVYAVTGSQRLDSISVCTQGIFVVTGSGSILVVSHAGVLQQEIQPIASSFFDVRCDANIGTIFAISDRAIYTLVSNGAGYTASLNVGDENTVCAAASDQPVPTFCGLRRLQVQSANELYAVSSTRTVRHIFASPQSVPVEIAVPFPVYFPTAEMIMPPLLEEMNSDLRAVPGMDPRVATSANSGSIDPDTWVSTFTVWVPQAAYDPATTPALIQSTTFPSTLAMLTAYYARTNQNVLVDRHVHSMCNLAWRHRITVAIAHAAGEALSFGHVYADAPVIVGTVPNLTSTKLLLPSSFENATTDATLPLVDFSATAIAESRVLYGPSHTWDYLFLESNLRLAPLTEEQVQVTRWMLQDLVWVRLNQCFSLDTSGITSEFDDVDCVVGITNFTAMSNPLVPAQDPYWQHITVFADPSVFPDLTDIGICLNQTDFTGLYNYTRGLNTRSGSRCGDGCIIGIAVAAAVVVTILVIIVVVLTSKRKRLATVVVPPQKSEEGYDVDTESGLSAMDSNNSNPLAPANNRSEL